MEIHNRVLREHFGIFPKSDQLIIALAGNPNVGKSTVFNALTGLRQHTGNWPGKTVDNAQGNFHYRHKNFLLVDLPGTYSILAHTVEEEVARNFICFGRPDVTVVVLDATALERNLNLALQVLEITPNVVVCVNLVDEAHKKKITIDFKRLEELLGVPVVPAAARKGIGLEELKEHIYTIALGLKTLKPFQVKYCHEIECSIKQLTAKMENLGLSQFLNPRWVALRLLDGDEQLVHNIIAHLNKQSFAALEGVEIAL